MVRGTHDRHFLGSFFAHPYIVVASAAKVLSWSPAYEQDRRVDGADHLRREVIAGGILSNRVLGVETPITPSRLVPGRDAARDAKG